MPNKVTREARALAKSIVEDATVQAKLLSQARRGRLAPPVMAMLFHYAYGKPRETVALEGGPESKPKKLVILIQRAPPGIHQTTGVIQQGPAVIPRVDVR